MQFALLLFQLTLVASIPAVSPTTKNEYGRSYVRREHQDSFSAAAVGHGSNLNKVRVPLRLFDAARGPAPTPGGKVDSRFGLHGQAPDSAKAVSLNSSIMTFSSLVLFMLCLYLTNYPNGDVKAASWKVISNSFALVYGIMVFTIITNIMDAIRELFPGHETKISHSLIQMDGGPAGVEHVPTTEDMVLAFVLFMLSFVVMELMLYCLMYRPWALGGWGIIGAHVCSFMSAEAFAITQEAPPFSESLGLNLVWVLITVAASSLLAIIAHKIRQIIVLADGVIDEEEKAWLHQCEHSEDEFVAFAIGLVVTQWIRFVLVGKILHFHGQQENDDTFAIGMLCLIAVAIGLIAFLFAASTLELRKTSETLDRLIGCVIQVLSMTCGWCFVFCGNWAFWYLKGEDDTWEYGTSLTVIALSFTAAGFMFIIKFDLLEKRFPETLTALEPMEEAMILLIGLSWEMVINEATKSSATALSDDPTREKEYLNFFASLIFILTFPGWYLFILPHALKSLHGHHDEHHENDPPPNDQQVIADGTTGRDDPPIGEQQLLENRLDQPSQ